jgi:hypothetical protein
VCVCVCVRTHPVLACSWRQFHVPSINMHTRTQCLVEETKQPRCPPLCLTRVSVLVAVLSCLPPCSSMLGLALALTPPTALALQGTPIAKQFSVGYILYIRLRD